MKKKFKNLVATKKDVTGLKKDVTGLKKDVTGLKKDVTGLKKDLSIFKEEMRKNWQDDLKKELSQYTTKVEFDFWIGRLYEEIVNTKKDVAEIKEILLRNNDYFSKNSEDTRAEMASFKIGHNRHEEKLGNHEIRITVLENH